MKHLRRVSPLQPPAEARTLLEWTQKGVIVNSFADALATLADAKATIEGD